MIFGPRDYVVSRALGRQAELEDYAMSDQPWVMFNPGGWDPSEFPELWVDKLHDAAWG